MEYKYRWLAWGDLNGFLRLLVGDLLYTWMAFCLAARTKNPNVTAMPMGLDTPSTLGIAFAVLGPTYLASHDPYLTRYVGMATFPPSSM